ncbi:MAG: hypothetical protein JOZ87_38115 [Chloroflexi bacterium]|nr:hypothetical protein [Chloroflexota bacterium]
MFSWLSHDLASEMIRERRAEAAAQLQADELAHEARAAAATARQRAARPHGLRYHVATAVRRFAVRLDPALASNGR